MVQILAGIYFREHSEAMLMLEILERELRERHGTKDEAIIAKWFNELSGVRAKAKSEQWGGWEKVGIIEKFVRNRIERVLDKTLPAIVERAVSERFSAHPNQELTKLGFEWAFYIELQKHWPSVSRPTAAKWLWEYVGVEHGDSGYNWTSFAAAELACAYATEFGERAA